MLVIMLQIVTLTQIRYFRVLKSFDVLNDEFELTQLSWA